MERNNTAMRRLAAVWFADIVGFTELSSRDEDAAMKLVELFQTVTRRAIPERGGTVVKFLGDGGLAVFPSSDAATRAGLAVQREFAERASAAGHPAALRIGIHVGEVIGAPDGDVPAIEGAASTWSGAGVDEPLIRGPGDDDVDLDRLLDAPQRALAQDLELVS